MVSAQLSDSDQARLSAIAKSRRPRVANWYGRRGGATRREYHCYVCDCVIDTESSRWPQTAHARQAIQAHGAEHIRDLDKCAIPLDDCDDLFLIPDPGPSYDRSPLSID